MKKVRGRELGRRRGCECLYDRIRLATIRASHPPTDRILATMCQWEAHTPIHPPICSQPGTECVNDSPLYGWVVCATIGKVWYDTFGQGLNNKHVHPGCPTYLQVHNCWVYLKIRRSEPIKHQIHQKETFMTEKEPFPHGSPIHPISYEGI